MCTPDVEQMEGVIMLSNANLSRVYRVHLQTVCCPTGSVKPGAVLLKHSFLVNFHLLI
jgi:hypothetical protein